MNSLIQDDNFPVCIVCHTTKGLHRHHIFYGTANRAISEREGCYCYLCCRHHNGSEYGVHFNKTLDTKLKKQCEQAWIDKNKSDKAGFIKVFGKNYL